MKKILSIILLLALFCSFSLCAMASYKNIYYDESSSREVIEENKQYAKENSIDFKKSSDVVIPSDVLNYAGVNLGSVISSLIEDSYVSNKTVVISVESFFDISNPSDATFFVPTDGPYHWYVMYKDELGTYTELWEIHRNSETPSGFGFHGPKNLKMFDEQKKVMDRLIKEAGYEGECELYMSDWYHMYLVYSFGGDQRIMPIGYDTYEDYLNVKSYKQLLTAEEFGIERYKKYVERKNEDKQYRLEMGYDESVVLYGGPPIYYLPPKEYDADTMANVSLLGNNADVVYDNSNIESAEINNTGNTYVYIIISVASVLGIAGTAIVIIMFTRRKKTN